MQFKSDSNSVVINSGISLKLIKDNTNNHYNNVVLEGRCIDQFTLHKDRIKFKTNYDINAVDYFRIGVRDITCKTNKRTMLCMIIPKYYNYLDTIKTIEIKLSNVDIIYLLSLLNSFVIDFYVRLMCSLHMNDYIIKVMPISYNEKYYNKIVELCAKLICIHDEYKELYDIKGVADVVERQSIRNQLDALIAHMYGLNHIELEYILSTFNIVEQEVKEDILRRFDAI